jgi:hypothetical protein
MVTFRALEWPPAYAGAILSLSGCPLLLLRACIVIGITDAVDALAAERARQCIVEGRAADPLSLAYSRSSMLLSSSVLAFI